MRLACLSVPMFAVQALRRSFPELAEAPLAVAAGSSPRDAVTAVAAEAAELGVGIGMTAAQARQVAPAAMVRAVPEEVTAAAGDALADVAESLSPRIRRSGPGEVLVDVGGLTPRWGSEARVADELLRRCIRIGLHARVGVAASAGTARVAARSGELVVVEPGRERGFLAALPVDRLGPSGGVAEALRRWGVRSAGQLAALPRAEVAVRLGGEGVALHRLACGEESRAFVPDPQREALREGVALEDPIAAVETFLFVLHGLLGRLARRLELRGEGFAEVTLGLSLEDGGRREVPVRLVAPTLEVGAVESLARLALEAHPPGAPVEGVAVLAVPGRLQLVQGSLFGAPMPSPGKLSMTLARLAALMGPERVGAPSIPDTHRPGAWNVVPFAPRQRDGGAAPPAAGHPPVLRVLRPPREAQVTVVGGRPVSVRAEELGGVVAGFAGPYRFVGEWWGEDPFARDDFDVATADGSLLRVFFDRVERRWFVDGIYD